MAYQFANNASSVLTADLGTGVLTAQITPSDASKFPVPSGADYFMAYLQKSTGELEIVKVTANPLTGSLTIVRAQEGTTEQAFVIGDFFELRLTSGAINSFPQKDSTLQTGLNAQKVNSIEAATTATANKLLALDATAKLPADITGDAQTLEGQNLAYILSKANHTGADVKPTIQVFSVNGTYTKPAELVTVKITAVGGGGNGGAWGGANDGGGGGGGGTAVIYLVASVIGATESIIVGGAATNTTFGAHVTAQKGVDAVASQGGAGGGALLADLTITGEAGFDYDSLPVARAGGNSSMPVIGKGGQGGQSGVSPTNGAAGIVIVEEFFS